MSTDLVSDIYTFENIFIKVNFKVVKSLNSNKIEWNFAARVAKINWDPLPPYFVPRKAQRTTIFE